MYRYVRTFESWLCSMIHNEEDIFSVWYYGMVPVPYVYEIMLLTLYVDSYSNSNHWGMSLSLFEKKYLWPYQIIRVLTDTARNDAIVHLVSITFGGSTWFNTNLFEMLTTDIDDKHCFFRSLIVDEPVKINQFSNQI